VPGPHQVTAGVFAGPDQVAGRFLGTAGHRDRGDLIEAQQPREVDRVFGVGLDPVPGGSLQLGGCRDHAPDPVLAQRPRQPEPGRTGLIGDRDRTRQPLNPATDIVMTRGQPGLPQLARDAIDRRRSNRSGVHVEPNTRTLREHRGLPHMSDRPSRRFPAR